MPYSYGSLTLFDILKLTSIPFSCIGVFSFFLVLFVALRAPTVDSPILKSLVNPLLHIIEFAYPLAAILFELYIYVFSGFCLCSLVSSNNILAFISALRHRLYLSLLLLYILHFCFLPLPVLRIRRHLILLVSGLFDASIVVGVIYPTG